MIKEHMLLEKKEQYIILLLVLNMFTICECEEEVFKIHFILIDSVAFTSPM